MKRSLYNLTDEPFAMFVNRIGRVLRDEGIEYNIVGGVAVQAYILESITEGTNVMNFLENPSVRIQDYFRNTDDVDVSLNFNLDDNEKMRRIKEILPQLEFEDFSPTESSIVGIKIERIGVSKPKFRFSVYGDNENYEEIVSMNISRNQRGDLHKLDGSLYEEFLKRHRRISIPYTKDFELEINVPSLEHLLSSKIALSRAKDVMDIRNLAKIAKDSGRQLNFDEMDKILLPYHEDNYSKFLEWEYPFEFRRVL